METVKNESLGIYCGYALGQVYNGTFVSKEGNENYILLDRLFAAGQPLRASLNPESLKNLVNGDKIRAKITFIFNFGSLNAEVIGKQ